MTTFFYFAYGSNMLTQRLQARCPSAIPVGLARTAGFSVSMTKRSEDGSGKATLAAASEGIRQEALGVIFEISENERRKLDDAEGRAYNRNDQFDAALIKNNQSYTTSTYIAGDDHIEIGLEPFCWYRALIIAGATQHGLPQDYVSALRARPFRTDPDLHRPSRKQAVNALASAGFMHLLP